MSTGRCDERWGELQCTGPPGHPGLHRYALSVHDLGVGGTYILADELAARDATIARLEGENADYERLSTMHRETRELREQKIAELRAEVERCRNGWDKGVIEERTRAEKAEVECERLRERDREWEVKLDVRIAMMEKAEAEVERLRKEKALANPEATLVALRGMSEADALQADLDEARAIVRDMAKALKVVGWGGDDLDINKRAVAFLGKGGR